MNYYPAPNGLPPEFADWTPRVDQTEVYAQMVREELAAVWSLVPIPPFVPPTCPERFRKYLEPLSSETVPLPQPKPQERGYSILFEGGRRWPSPEPDPVEQCEEMSIASEREPETEIGVIYMGDCGVRQRRHEPESSPMPVDFAGAEPTEFCREDFIQPANASHKRKAEDSEVEELEGMQADVAEVEVTEVNEVPVVGAKRQKYEHVNELSAFFKRPLKKLWGILGWK